MKRMITKQLLRILAVVLVLSLVINFVIQMLDIQSAMKKESDIIFAQVEQILAENSQDLSTVVDSYRQTAINNADAVAYIIQNKPSVLKNISELTSIAKLLEIDEIHIFDNTGVIINGTNPEYYGLSMDDGEQIGFFKPMLTDKNLKACQEVTPNTAVGKQMQYSAVWNSDKSLIVQVGNEPTRILEQTRKNELSYIFSLLTSENGSDLYAIDRNNNAIILGSTNQSTVGKSIFDIGVENNNRLNKRGGFHATVDGNLSYCTYKELDSILILRACSCDVLYDDIISYTLFMILYLVVTAIFLLYSAVKYLDRHIISGINSVNRKLTDITNGNFDAEVKVTTTPEFAELSSHINTMVDSILSTTDKISYVLDSAKLPIGVYEYSTNMPRVRVTKHTCDILHLSHSLAESVLSDYELFEKYINQIESNTIDGYEHIYYINNKKEYYVKIQHFEKDGNILGIVTDVTKEMQKHKNLENERDIDVLTGLYNRRGLESHLDRLFKEPDALGYSALIMLDADGLKFINDKYGHEAGDRYLCTIASIIKNVAPPLHVLSRQGGDEFVLFFYGCNSDDEIRSYIDKLKSIRDNKTMEIISNTIIPVRYSLGYVFCHNSEASHYTLLRDADDLMYDDKRIRKAQR